ncbi:ABC transporter permease subunit [Archaeoglobus fulgidus]|uniref:Branched-chain amino acid ABC transporter, permease protein (BraE-3) n=2 Tax=Archaeoglobus fulgidus TaxID=2234 RepID=O29302_ARCFU|nr:branched-chain amino acid ABC transporter permease [Archaeoglobus fulgidus]AAB90283.1 branched-chain amino acid ABC transporter, permease protein (braE-3) [Archaeoglobus fulgidus DSM 4304]KUJ93141.1 MAG: Branched-chain amino acid ABC transporter, permease protein (BraE-3) [Archaeoglobus fulgidus]KUK06807.1 MAG: Branched-chain amino acid ABC transporter, permease protein (BraE-3) [Archaeoglobus fulgidus]
MVALKAELLLLALLILLPATFQSSFAVSVAALAMIYSTLSLSWYFMERRAGWVSLSHSIPFGLAAYCLAINPFLILLSVVASLLIFLGLSRLGRENFPFATFFTAVIFWYLSHYIVVEKNGEMVGGEEGFGFTSIGLLNSYLLASLLLTLTVFFLMAVKRSALGLKIEAVRDDEVAARAVGIDVLKIRAVSFLISVILATLAGVCYLLYFGHASPEIFSMEVALLPYIATLIAGKRLISPVVGSYVVVVVSRAFSGVLPEAHLLLYAAVLILSPKLSRWWNAQSD